MDTSKYPTWFFQVTTGFKTMYKNFRKNVTSVHLFGLGSYSGWRDESEKKIVQNVAQPIFDQINKKKDPNILGYIQP
jgi:hypothetical protein